MGSLTLLQLGVQLSVVDESLAVVLQRLLPSLALRHGCRAAGKPAGGQNCWSRCHYTPQKIMRIIFRFSVKICADSTLIITSSTVSRALPHRLVFCLTATKKGVVSSLGRKASLKSSTFDLFIRRNTAKRLRESSQLLDQSCQLCSLGEFRIS